jgi:hypothetical protein
MDGKQRGVHIQAGSEPSGCAAGYWVSAYGPAGESPPSNTVTAETAPPSARVQVTFKSLLVSKKIAGYRIDLHANQYKRTSNSMTITSTVPIDLDGIPFGGQMPNNVITVPLEKDEALQIGLKAGYCQVSTILSPQKGWDSFEKESFQLRAPKSSYGTCGVQIDVSTIESLKAGQISDREADVYFYGAFLMGKDVYVRLGSGGPDDLWANQIQLQSYWVKPAGSTKGKAEERISPVRIVESWWSPGRDRTTIRANSLTIAKDVNGDDVDVIPDPQAAVLRVEVVPLNFTDPNVKNNKIDTVPTMNR